MDLSTMLRNVKSGRYKTKADFVTDLDLIWDNCLYYNSQEVRPYLRPNRQANE
jgi:transcriptional activator SPT7